MKQLLLIILVLFIVSCVSPEDILVEELPKVEEVKEQPVEEIDAEPIQEIAKTTSCKFSSDCENGFYCIETQCKSIESLNEKKQKCELCTFKTATILTSDGETYTEGQGKGSYTYAGALEWKIVPMPKYCKGDTKVPITIFKRNYDEVFGDEVIVLKKGEKSTVLTHPLIDELKFTLEVIDITESCS
jgi:hypothetical protein